MANISNKHVSQQRKSKVHKQLMMRIRLLKKLIHWRLVPEKFKAYQSDNKMCKYSSGKLEKISLNAAKNNIELWRELKYLMSLYAAQKKEILSSQLNNHQSLGSDNDGNRKAISVTKQKLINRVSKLTKQNQILTSELLKLRGMYLDLLQKTQDAEHLSQRHREAIKRHKEHFGLTVILE